LGVVADNPITGMRSGIWPSIPVQVRITCAPLRAGTRSRVFAIPVSDCSVIGRE
jgi:hypothetical protein